MAREVTGLRGEHNWNTPDGERAPIKIHPEVRNALLDLLQQPWMRGVGYSEFVHRAIDAAYREQEMYEQFRQTFEGNTRDFVLGVHSDTADRLREELADFNGFKVRSAPEGMLDRDEMLVFSEPKWDLKLPSMDNQPDFYRQDFQAEMYRMALGFDIGGTRQVPAWQVAKREARTARRALDMLSADRQFSRRWWRLLWKEIRADFRADWLRNVHPDRTVTEITSARRLSHAAVTGLSS